MSTKKVQLNGVRISRRCFDRLKVLHSKDTIGSFSGFIEKVLDAYAFETEKVLSVRDMKASDFDPKDFE